MLGSDYPFPLGEHHPGKLIESVEDWEQSTKVAFFLICQLTRLATLCLPLQDKLLFSNALNFLGMTKGHFEDEVN